MLATVILFVPLHLPATSIRSHACRATRQVQLSVGTVHVHVSGLPAWMAVCRGRVRLRGGHAPRGVVSSPPCARGYPGAQ